MKHVHQVKRGYDAPVRSRITFPEQGRTLQAHKDECDINRIIKTFTKTGVITHGTARAPVYGDVFDVPNYQEHLNQILAAQSAFEALPAEVRKIFDNDPAKFVEGVDLPEHKEILQKLGFKKPDKEEETDDAASRLPDASAPGEPLPEKAPDVSTDAE